MDILESSYADLIAAKTRDSFTLSYISFAQGTEPETYQYRVFGANTLTYFKCLLSDPIEVAAFEAAYKNGAQEVASETEALIKSRAPVTASGSLSSSSTLALQTVLTYTVPAKQTFHLEQWMVGRINAGNAEMTLAQLQVNGAAVDGQSNSSLSGAPFYERKYAHPLPVATAGQIITIKVTPNAGGATTFGARLLGELR